MSAVAGLIAVCCFTLFGSELRAQDPARIPVIVDTDIGTDIDDAFALALLLQCPELELRGITTVSGDAPLRARLAALTATWQGTNPWKLVHPVLFDSLPVALLARPALAETMARHIEIAPDGLTRAWPGAPNADVVVRAPPEEFFAFNHVRLSAPSAPVR